MLVEIIRFFRGYVDFSVEGKFPERFINLTAVNGINIWNTTPMRGGLNASMSAFDYRKIRKITRKSGTKTKIFAKHGLPFLIHRYRKRSGLLVGALIGTAMLIFLCNFIWSVNIVGLQTVSETTLRTVLSEYGVEAGAYKHAVNVQSAERNISLDIKQISWMSINIVGNTASVEIKEKAEKPKLNTDASPCNIKAACDGVITKIKGRSGETQVIEGSGVAKGDLLVSGVVESKLGEVQYVHAQAEIYADVYSDKEFKIPKSGKYYSLTENKFNKFRTSFLWLDFPCSISFKGFENSLSVEKNFSPYYNKTFLPISLREKNEYELLSLDFKLKKSEAQNIVENQMLLYEIFKMPESKVVSRKTEFEDRENEYICKISYIFNENIAQTVKFSVTD